jgi:hypothetical protein
MGASVYLFGSQWTVCTCLNFFWTVWPSFVTWHFGEHSVARMWWKLRVGGKRNYPKWSWKYRFIFNLALNQNLQRSQLEYARMIHSSPQLVCISKWERTNLAHPTPCTRTSSVQKLLQEFGHSPTNICYKTRPHSPKKVQASTKMNLYFQDHFG